MSCVYVCACVCMRRTGWREGVRVEVVGEVFTGVMVESTADVVRSFQQVIYNFERSEFLQVGKVNLFNVSVCFI